VQSGLDLEVEIGVEGGEALAAKTLNPRLGIIGGLSILGTTGIVVPYSCSAWIYGIRQGIDVARAIGLSHVAGATGATSEAAIRKYYQLPEHALIDMGDFVGGLLKYLRAHPLPRLTIAGGVAKMTKLAQGLLDLHSARGTVDLAALAVFSDRAGGSAELHGKIVTANTAAEAFAHAADAGVNLGDVVARAAQKTAVQVVEGRDIAVEVVLFDREGRTVGHAPFSEPHRSAPRKRR
jgi:cobalt-precorrin-5B (C1)-methyltransferase